MTTTHEPDDLRMRSTRRAMTTVGTAGYALGCYLLFVAVFGYAVAFLADVVVPRTVDRSVFHTGTLAAFAIDAALLAVFAIQHSVMARPAFKQRWTRLVLAHVERSTYVLASSVALALAFWQWRPLPTVVWDAHAPAARVLLWALFALGWVWVLAMSYAIDHFDLFGLSRVFRHLRGLAHEPSSFVLPWAYRLVRHPMMLGFFPAFLAVPRMTVGHLLFAALGCGYILVGVRLEERDLADELPEYAAYAAVTPRLLPRLRRRGTRG